MAFRRERIKDEASDDNWMCHASIVSHLADLFHCRKIMYDIGQPGELPLMRELAAIKRARSLRDPSTAVSLKSPVFKAPLLNPSWKSPLSDSGSRIGEAERVAGRGEFHSGQFSGSNGRSGSRSGVGSRASQWSESLDDSDGLQSWDLGVEETVMEDEREQDEVFGGKADEAKSAKFKGAELIRQANVNRGRHGDRSALLLKWREATLAAQMEGIARAKQVHARERSQRQNRSLDLSAAAAAPAQNRDAYEFENQADARRRSWKDQAGRGRFPNTTSRRGSVSKQTAQVLSPLVLNSLDDLNHSESVFSLESPYCERLELGNGRNAASRSQSPILPKHLTRSRLRESVKSSWRSHTLQPCSTSTSQRTVSQASIPGAWDDGTSNQALDDELDVSELPRNGCGIPCYWSKSQKRGKSLLDIAGRSFSCGFSDSSRRKGHSSSELLPGSQSASQLGADDMEALPLLTDPSAASDDAGISSADDSDRVSSALNGELGLDCRSMRNAPRTAASDRQGKAQRDVNVAGGKELAIFVERPRSLSQKYRPKLFDDLVGQNIVAHALSNAILRGKIAPVYLFQGSRGTGKTSVARIFAAALNCLSPEDRRPCGVCNECIVLASGKSLDVREVDAASTNGFARVKALLQSTLSAPSRSRYKVFIVDECHMLTTETWNALLKLLEEPPGNAVFILITTDPDKLPCTAVSRCQKFPFPKIKESAIVSRLQTLVKLENLEVEPGALELIASRSDGSLRDAETILDQLSLLGQKITLSMVHQLVGSVSDEKLMSLLELALCSDTVSTVQRARELIDSGVEPLDLMSQLATLITDILAGSNELVNKNQNGGFFSRHALSEEELERLRIALRILAEAEKQLRAASNDRTTWLTAALLQFGPGRPCMVSSSSGTSLAASPITRTNFNDRKYLGTKAINGRKEGSEKGMLTERNRMGSSKVKGKTRPINSSLNVRVRQNNLSINASRETSNAASRAESPVYKEVYEKHVSFVSPRNLGSLWCNVLERCKSLPLRQLLLNHGQLLAVSISAGDAMVHLEFGSPEHKSRAERCIKSIANAFQTVLGLSIDVKISLASLPDGAEGVGSRLWSVVDQSAKLQGDLKHCASASKGDHTLQHDEITHEAGSLHKVKNRGGVAVCNKREQACSPQTFRNAMTADALQPARFASNSSMLAGSTMSGQRGEITLAEQERLESAWIFEASRFSPSHERVCQIGNEARPQEIVLEDMDAEIKDNKKTSERVQTEQIMQDNYMDCASPSCNGDKNEHVSDLEDQNLRLESRFKYGGLLCWKAPKLDKEKVTSKRHRRKKSAILIRLVPCAKSRG